MLTVTELLVIVEVLHELWFTTDRLGPVDRVREEFHATECACQRLLNIPASGNNSFVSYVVASLVYTWSLSLLEPHCRGIRVLEVKTRGGGGVCHSTRLDSMVQIVVRQLVSLECSVIIHLKIACCRSLCDRRPKT